MTALPEVAREDSSTTSGPMVMDAHLAALALEHGASIATTDRDFTRFPGIDLMDPTEATSHQA